MSSTFLYSLWMHFESKGDKEGRDLIREHLRNEGINVETFLKIESDKFFEARKDYAFC